ncbi:uncharacterized protein LOC119690462 [Plutella xylostella]|uniref:uncharacterized protein LOC119690462 n=1 Tax=Plutella xylostella TaxID=51655 RepID=UPI002032BDE5|nr:uncharacterized protein LOC119690462 [Plutella xylostella]
MVKVLWIFLFATTSAHVIPMDQSSFVTPFYIRTNNRLSLLQFTRPITNPYNMGNLVKHLASVNVIPYKLAQAKTQEVYSDDNSQVVTHTVPAVVRINNRINEVTTKNHLADNDNSTKDIPKKPANQGDDSGSSEYPSSTEGASTTTEDYETTTFENDLSNRLGVDPRVVASLLGG